MDTSDSLITYDDNGICDHCQNYYDNIKPKWDTLDEDKLLGISKNIKRDNKNSEFDCIIGISGGLDSSYCVYIAKEIMGLNPLLVHVDAGWNTKQAVSNIQNLIEGLGLELFTEVINWEEMKELQLAFLKSGIPDQDLPQDYAFFSTLYRFAKKHKIKYILTGSNFSTECIREPEEWGAHTGIDSILVKDILKKFGPKKRMKFKVLDIFYYKIYYRYLYKIKVIHPCNYLEYNKEKVEKFLFEKFGWEKFKHKHHESRFTRFFEDYWLVNKFGFDKRKAHFSSLILTGQMTREEALNRLKSSELGDAFHNKEMNFIANKLDISKDQLIEIYNKQNKTINAYKNNKKFIRLGKLFLKYFGTEKRNIR
jgi:N-acetyl sugar amidotransferase